MNTMNLIDTYLANTGYDYYDNAAEDTLVFFVRDEGAPNAEPSEGNDNETITNSVTTPDSSTEDDDLSDSIPKIAETDTKQTEVKHSDGLKS